jgi:hypothetical protein
VILVHISEEKKCMLNVRKCTNYYPISFLKTKNMTSKVLILTVVSYSFILFGGKGRK